ncbi:MAG: FAD-dependent oxidoreductase [Planctomycetota bacterium]|jgi:hypothetical protein
MAISRRQLLERFGVAAGTLFASDSIVRATPVRVGGRAMGNELYAPVVIVGGGLGGCAAALAVLRSGIPTILTEETDWIGGQLTQQAVPPDENPWIETFGGTRAYRELRNQIRDYYRRHYPLSKKAGKARYLNPGNGNVSRLCHEPRVALAVLQSLFAPYISSGRLTMLLNHKAVAADTQGDRVRAVGLKNIRNGREIYVTGEYFLDATEQGDLLPLSKTEYVTGFESQKETSEPHAPSEAQPQNIQACTWVFAMDYLEGQDHTIEKPQDYGFWRNHVPRLTPPWPGALLSWQMSHPQTLKPRQLTFSPLADKKGSSLNLWRYRRIVDKSNFVEGAYLSDITIVNWPQNDFNLGNLHAVSGKESIINFERARQLSLSLLYWLQTEAPRPDGKSGWKGLRLRKDIVGTDDGLAKYPYIRESRRIRAEFIVLEQHVGTQARMELTGKSKDEVTAEDFPDSVGIGWYRIDLHPSSGGDNYIDLGAVPFQIPLGALIPRRVENLIAAAKNLGVTHITNGCYRLHPVEWNIGESAGLLAVVCLKKKEPPRYIRKHKPLLSHLQKVLGHYGVEIQWPPGHSL